MGPEFNELWDRYFKDKPDKPVMFGSIVAGAYADHTLLPPGKFITMYVTFLMGNSTAIYWFHAGSSTSSTLRAVARCVARWTIMLFTLSRVSSDSHQVGQPICRAVLRQRFHEQQGRLCAYSLELQEDT